MLTRYLNYAAKASCPNQLVIGKTFLRDSEKKFAKTMQRVIEEYRGHLLMIREIINLYMTKIITNAPKPEKAILQKYINNVSYNAEKSRNFIPLKNQRKLLGISAQVPELNNLTVVILYDNYLHFHKYFIFAYLFN